MRKKAPPGQKGRGLQIIISFANFLGTLGLKSILAKGCACLLRRALSERRTKQDDWPEENKDLEELPPCKWFNPPQKPTSLSLSYWACLCVYLRVFLSLFKHSTYFTIFRLFVEIPSQREKRPRAALRPGFNPWSGNWDPASSRRNHGHPTPPPPPPPENRRVTFYSFQCHYQLSIMPLSSPEPLSVSIPIAPSIV